MQGGVDVNCYLDRIEIRSGYFTIWLMNKPVGSGYASGIGWWTDAILQDLDNPRRVYTPINSDSTDNGDFVTYQGITTTRFSLTRDTAIPPIIFEEIILGEPDAE
jgi:hypothetical protein